MVKFLRGMTKKMVTIPERDDHKSGQLPDREDHRGVCPDRETPGESALIGRPPKS